MDAADERKTERLAMMISKTEVGQIDDWGFANRIRTRAEAIRALVKKGLEADRHKASEATTGRVA